MLFIKGFIIGIGKMMPGVSGAMLAISMNIYKPLINSVSNFFKDIKTNFKFLFKVCFGILVAILIFSKIILLLLNNYYIVTILFFLGLILGGLKDIRLKLVKKNNYITIISFIVILILGLLSLNNEVKIINPIYYFLYYVLAGFLESFTMIIPGISGTATLMSIGAYNEIMWAVSNLLDFNLILINIKILIPFIIGMIIGFIITIKLVNYLFNYHESKTYSSIYGFSIATVLVMGLSCINTYYSFYELILAFIMLYIGYKISKKINHFIND